MRILLLLTAVLGLLPDLSYSTTYNRHHLRLDASLSASDTEASPYLFSEVREALSAIAKFDGCESDTITLDIAPGVYWVDDPDDPTIRRVSSPKGDGTPYGFVLQSKAHLRLVGLTEDARRVVLACNRGQTQGALGNFTMLRLDCPTVEAHNITFGNYCNVDLVYPDDSTLSRPRRAKAIVQAQLIHTSARFVRAEGCRFISRLNLCPFSGVGRAWFSDCHFECTDDALEGAAIYQRCHFEFFSGKPFWGTPDFGAVFLDCQIDTHVRGTQYFNKTRGGITLIRTHIRQLEEDSLRIQPCYGISNAPCYYSQCTLNGRPLHIDGAQDITGLPLLEAFTVENLLHGPIPTYMRLQPVNTRSLGEEEESWPMQLQFFCWNGKPARRHFSETLLLHASLPSGLVADSRLPLMPQWDEAPTFTQQPSLTVDRRQNSLQLHYRLSPGRDDNSLITWYRYSADDLSDTLAVRYGRASSPKSLLYPLSHADRGQRILVRVTPQYATTHSGISALAHSDVAREGHMLRLLQKEEQNYATDFHDVPVYPQPRLAEGSWTFDAYKPIDTQSYNWEPNPNHAWFYGEGMDGALGHHGLIQATKGARCFYTPARSHCEAMTASLNILPSKTAGQGFGSATGQYLDIGLCFDPIHLSGYALRIERSPKYDRACLFRLVHYQEGVVSAISEPQVSDCFRGVCHLSLQLTGDTFSVAATNDLGGMPVNLSVPVSTEVPAVPSPNSRCFYMQHTGSTGPSACTILSVELTFR